MSNTNTARADEMLFNLTRQCGHVDLLFDRWLGDPLAQDIAELGLDANCAAPVVDRMFQKTPERAPLLLRLTNAHAAFIDKTLALATQEATDANPKHRYVCGWLYSKEPFASLAAKLRSRMNAVLKDSGTQIYFRYFEPRTLPRIVQILDKNQLAELLGPIHHWCWIERDGSFAQTNNPKPDTLMPASGLIYQGAQEQAFLRVASVNNVVAQLRQLGKSAPRKRDPQIDAHLVQAQQLGLRDDADRETYALYAELEGQRFTQDSTAQALVEQTVSQGIPLETLLQEKWTRGASAAATTST